MTFETLLRVLECLGVVAAAIAAVRGLTMWRTQMVGRRRYRLAEDVLTLFYEARDAIDYMRNPWSDAGEGSNRSVDPRETPEEKSVLDGANIPFERYQSRRRVFNRLHALRYRFQAVFGREHLAPFDDLRSIVREILVAAQMLSFLKHPKQATLHRDSWGAYLAEIRSHERIFWHIPQDDPLEPRIDATIKLIESVCEPEIRKVS